jgi:hypothetical protein
VLMQASQQLWISYSEKYQDGSLLHLITHKQWSFHIKWAFLETRIQYNRSAPLSLFLFTSLTSAKPLKWCNINAWHLVLILRFPMTNIYTMGSN